MRISPFSEDSKTWITIVPSIVLAALLNTFLNWLFDVPIKTPLFLDSSFTIVAGIFFGPLPGMITGLLTNVFMALLNKFQGAYLPFAVVNMATGLCAGLIARNKKVFWTLSRQLSLILILTLVNALLGALVATIVYGGVTGTLPDIPVSALILLGRGIFSSAFLARILINIVDKGLPVMMIYIIYRIVEYKKGGNEDIDF